MALLGYMMLRDKFMRLLASILANVIVFNRTYTAKHNRAGPARCAGVFGVSVNKAQAYLTAGRCSPHLGLGSVKMTMKARKLWFLNYSQEGNKMFTYK